jgi:hypothetical protein
MHALPAFGNDDAWSELSMYSLACTGIRMKCAVLFTLGALFGLSSVTSFAIGNLTLAWDPSTTPGVTYKVYYGPSSATYANSVFAGTATNVTVSNLVDGVTYYFAATASDDQWPGK